MTVRQAGERRAIAAALGTFLALSLSAPAAADATAQTPTSTAVPSGNITVQVVANNGSGCAPGTASVHADANKTGFRIRYSDFLAEAGGSAAVTDRRKNCQMSVLVTVPAGWTFAIASVNYRGRARLNSGASGLHRTTYYWQGSSRSESTEQEFTGPFHGFWSSHDVAPVLIYSPCGDERILNVNTELRVDAGGSTSRSSLSLRSAEGDVDTLFNIEWAQC
jgi:hypothetical protein